MHIKAEQYLRRIRDCFKSVQVNWVNLRVGHIVPVESAASADSFAFSFANNVGDYDLVPVTGNITLPAGCTVSCAATSVILTGPLSFAIQDSAYPPTRSALFPTAMCSRGPSLKTVSRNRRQERSWP